MIWEYERRRRLLREKFGLDPNKRPQRAPKEYKEVADLYNKKIKQWTVEMKRVDATKARIVFLERSVRLFLEISFIGNASNKPEVALAKSIFYKYGLEDGLRGVDLCQHLGDKTLENAARWRKRFTNSFVDNRANKELWLRFKAIHHRRVEAEESRIIRIKLKKAA